VKSFGRLAKLEVRSLRRGFDLLFNSWMGRSALGKVGLYLDKTTDTALSIFPPDVAAIPPRVAREVAERTLRNYPRASVDVETMATHATVIHENAYPFLQGPNGAFRVGAHAVIPHDGSASIPFSCALERVICTNGAVIRHREFAFHLDTGVSFPQLTGEIEFGLTSVSRHAERFPWAKDRLHAMKGTTASLQEFLEAHGEILRNGLKALAWPLRIEEVLDAYGVAHVRQLPHRWRCTATTPLTRLDIFHIVTEIAGHHTQGETAEGIQARQRLMRYAGALLANKGHLENVAPPRSWPAPVERPFYLQN